MNQEGPSDAALAAAQECDRLCTSVEQYRQQALPGSDLLYSRLLAERDFLRKPNLRANQLNCTNLAHYAAVLQACDEFPHVTGLLRVFGYSGGRLRVDVVAEHGLCWVKVVARNAKQMLKTWAGQTSSSERGVVEQATAYRQAAAECGFPRLVFYFTRGVPSVIAKQLVQLGVEVHGETVELTLPELQTSDSPPLTPDSNRSSDSSEDASDNDELDAFNSSIDFASIPLPADRPLNLDVTVLMALTSEMTHGGAQYTYKQPLLNEQAAWERAQPALPFLETVMKDRKLICCATAWQSFEEIMQIVGGPKEKQRALDLKQKLEMVADQMSSRAEQLIQAGRVKDRAKIIFGTGDALGAITLTANKGFVQAAQNQGVTFSVLLHEARALSELKQDESSRLDK